MSKTDRRKKTRSKPKPQNPVAAFLLKTYEILENPTYHDIACWNKDGTAFIVKNVTEFSDKILPKYFKHNNFASFVRQLNMYDFHKSRQENNENEFCHRLFQRGQKDLLGEIKRKITDIQPTPQSQLVPVTRELDFDKFKKEASLFTNELKVMKGRQTELEKVTKMLYGQNTKLLKENKLLWGELIKNKDKYERKIEKLMLFVFSVVRYSGKKEVIGPTNSKKSLGTAESSDAGSDIGNGLDSDNFRGRLDNDDDNAATMSLLSDKKDHEKFFKKIVKSFQNKGNKSTLDRLIESAQRGSLENFLNGQDNAESSENDDDSEYPFDTEAIKSRMAPEKTRGRKRIKGKRNPPNRDKVESDEEAPTEKISKMIKVESEDNKSVPNLLPTNDTNELFDLDQFSEVPARQQSIDFPTLKYQDSFKLNPEPAMPSALIPYTYPPQSYLDYLPSPKQFFNPPKEDFENLIEKDNQEKINDFLKNEQDQGQKSNLNVNENIACFSPSAFMNNSDIFNFEQKTDEGFDRS